ncbi:GAP family protein [Mycobacterium sp. E2497]|uniref:GAP family protein n=1 Tax=Mycobacterium sp. E2497 TaxID=1834135 RepID=UPI000800C7D5|nr:GAP family protein [Mycobacterium sp. E2497]OBI12855.1 hypothetical protein A5713_04040 [Mycobacterium sp. E2497]
MHIVLALAIFAAANPIRLGIALVLISRPRPMLNLFTFWLGATITGITTGLAALIGVRGFAPAFIQSVSALGQSPAARHAQVGIGLAMLSVTALTAVGFSVRRTQVSGGAPPATLPGADGPNTFARLRGRAENVLEGERLSVPFVVGLGSGFPAAEYPVALAVTMASGGPIGMQISAVIMFVAVNLAIIEIPLISYWATPAHTKAAMLRLHDWVRPRRRRIVAIIVTAVGVLLVANGMS